MNQQLTSNPKFPPFKLSTRNNGKANLMANEILQLPPEPPFTYPGSYESKNFQLP